MIFSTGFSSKIFGGEARISSQIAVSDSTKKRIFFNSEAQKNDSTTAFPNLKNRKKFTPSKTITQSGDSTLIKDTTHNHQNTVLPDSAKSFGGSDTAYLLPISPNALTEIINYKALDSVALNVSLRQAQLYNEGEITFEDMILKSNDILVDFDKQTLRAKGTNDSLGAYQGRPYFKQSDQEYYADTITFNYHNQKGIISGVITQEGDGFLHGYKVKKLNDSVMFLNGGMYTTCNYAHPHFALNFTKSKLIAGDKIITGPAYLTIEDVPTPLVLPFAFFPLTHDRASGLIMPSYGWMNGRGYYLKDGGYYLALNDNFDLSIMGEIYTNLSWKGELKSNYYKRYKYKGSFDIIYGRTKTGIRGDTNTFHSYTDYKVRWTHEQDAKANPNSRFSANVELPSRNFSRNTTNRNDYFSGTTTSSVAYSAQIGNFLNLATSLNESYNSLTGLMNLKLPSFSLSTNTFYPFRKKMSSGNYKWYENISMSYVFEGENNIAENDTNILKKSTLQKAQYGIQHRLPISSNIKVLRYFNWTNSASYNERWHWSTIEKNFDPVTQKVSIDTIRGFRSNRDVSFNSSLTTRVYGMFNFKYGPVKALRHVINPSFTFNFRPDFGSEKFGYWKSYKDSTGYEYRYSIFEQSLYGGPADGKSGQIRLSVGNNLEMKVASKKDTVDGFKKVTLIENLNIDMSYDLAKDSLNWSNLNISGRTTLFKNLLLNYSASFIPYVVDSLGRKFNKLLWKEEGKLFRKENATWAAQLSWNLNSNSFDNNSKRHNSEKKIPSIQQTPYNYNPYLMIGEYVDFSIPWNLTFNYTMSYLNKYDAARYNYKSEFIQTLSVTGNVSITDNWKIAITTGYDFVNKGMSYTALDIYRDLHCWEMRFNWIPFGYYKSWNFTINIKANSLKDVKYEKKGNYQDNKGYYSY